jgi:hydroxyacylglutathione hydrolase
MMLEDDFTYVLRKALMGHGWAPAEAAKLAGLSEIEVMAFSRGNFSAETARRLATALGLNVNAFVRHPTYQPPPVALAGIERLDLPFGEERVNAWLVREGDSAVLFDTGFKAPDTMKALDFHLGRLPDRVFITHGHHDHVAAVEDLLAAGLPVHGSEIAGTLPMLPGATVLCGRLAVRACDLSGHARPALGFHIDGLSLPVLVTGDALFAGSMGGCASPEIYQLALRRLREVLGPLPDSTVLLPGHGPATTLGGERLANPFL